MGTFKLIPLVYCPNCKEQLKLEEIAAWECDQCGTHLEVPSPPPNLRQPELIILPEEEFDQVRVEACGGCLAHADKRCAHPYEDEKGILPLHIEEGGYHPRKLAGCQVYFCLCCKRYVPWCSGSSADDKDLDLLCDDCTIAHPKWIAQEVLGW